jgi:flavin reductase (DIM6/NTAB) family NADH-FMN oxidoreductase RutF
MEEVELPVDKWLWHIGLIQGTIVLISTYDASGQPNVAPKSWVQMVSFEPSVLMFSGSRGNTTERNILEKECFGVNLVDTSIAPRAFRSIKWHGLERIERSAFELVKASRIDAPLVNDCPGHLECRLCRTIEVGRGLVIFGEIVKVSIREDIVTASLRDRYRLLDPALYLEEGTFASLKATFSVD